MSSALPAAMEARDLCRSLILAERTIPYAKVKRAAERLGLEVSRAAFRAVQTELAGTVRGADTGPPAMEENSTEAERVLEEPAVRQEPARTSTDFMVAYLQDRPGAAFEEVREAAEQEGHAVFPMTFEHARQLARPPKPPAPAEKMPGRRSASMAFLVQYVREHPEASYALVKAAAEGEGHQVFPVTYGNARRAAGLEKLTAGQVKGRNHVAMPEKPKPSRAPRSASTRAKGTGDAVIEGLRRLQQALTEMRDTLARIRDVAEDCLDRSR